jgi:hypothetical protein
MPNHVTNRVTITGQSIFDEWSCRRAVVNAEGNFDLGKVIPMPESMHVQASVTEVDIAKGQANAAMTRTGDHVNPKHVEIMRKNLEEHGYAYWYDFANDNWGTKWNAYKHANELGEIVCDDAARVLADSLLAQGHPEAEDFALAVHRGELRRAGVLVFETAWSTPRPVYGEMARRFPSVAIVVEYADEDIGSNCGTLTFEGGELVSDVCPDNDDDAVAFSYRVTGDTPYEDEDEDEATQEA